MNRFPTVGFTLVRIATVYLMLGLGLGVFMGITQSLALMSVHSHVGLLGWVAMAISGLVYVLVPRCDGNRLALLHFWLLNLGLPLMVASLVWIEFGGAQLAETLTGIGSIVVVAGLLSFTLNVFRNFRSA